MPRHLPPLELVKRGAQPFQFSIGDAPVEIVASIFTSKSQFQFSIGDAVFEQPSEARGVRVGFQFSIGDAIADSEGAPALVA